MLTLILIFSVKTLYNTSIDVRQIGSYNSQSTCMDTGAKIANIIKSSDPSIKVDYFCQAG